jgi:hypothetical protein
MCLSKKKSHKQMNDSNWGVAKTACSLNVLGFMASRLMSLMHKNEKKTMLGNHTTKAKMQNLSLMMIPEMAHRISP